MFYTLCLTIGTLLERFVNFEFGFVQFGPGDLFVLAALPYCYVVYGRALSFFVYAAIVAFLIILVSIIVNKNSYGFNTLITVPLRIFASGIVVYELLQLRRFYLWFSVLAALIVISTLFVFFLSDGSPFSFAPLFNRNELLCYIATFLMMAILINGLSKPQRFESVRRGFPVYYLVFPVFFLVISAVIQSRQNVLASCLSILIMLFAFSGLRRTLIISVLLLLFLMVSPIILQKILSDEKLNARVNTVTELEPATRADKYRLNNIIQAIDGFERSPVFGNGPTSFRKHNLLNKVAHSTPFSTLYELGMFGLLFLFFVYLKIIKIAAIVLWRKEMPAEMMLVSTMLPMIIVQSFFIELLPKAPLYIYLSVAYLLAKKNEEFASMSRGYLLTNHK